ncbi:MAG: TolC family protein [Gemmatimonadales bacterium]|jgi:outer membrane protein TolC
MDESGRRAAGRRRVPATVAVAAAAALLVVGPAWAQAPGEAAAPVRALSFRDALAMALEHNPQLAGARAEQRRVEGEALRPLQGILPTLQVQEQWLRSDDPSTVLAFKMKQGTFSPSDFSSPTAITSPGPLATFSGEVALQVPLLNADAWLGRGQGRSGVRAARLGTERAEQQLTFGVVRAYFALPLAAERLAAVREAEAALARAVAQAEALERQRLVAPLDVLQARSRLAAMRAEEANAIADSVRAAVGLEQVLGGSLGNVGAADPLPDSVPVPALDEALAALRSRPDVAAREEALAAARLGVHRVNAGWLPRLNGFAQVDLYDRKVLGTGRSYLTTGVVASWSLFDGMHQLAEERGARAARERAEAERDAALLEARTEVRTAQAEHEAARLARVNAQEAYDLAREARAIAETRYRNSLASMTELLAAQAAETAAATGLSAARYAFVVTAGAYRLAAGINVMEE